MKASNEQIKMRIEWLKKMYPQYKDDEEFLRTVAEIDFDAPDALDRISNLYRDWRQKLN